MSKIVDEIASQVIYKENERRTAIGTILDSLRIMHDEGRIGDGDYLWSVTWVRDQVERR